MKMLCLQFEMMFLGYNRVTTIDLKVIQSLGSSTIQFVPSR